MENKQKNPVAQPVPSAGSKPQEEGGTARRNTRVRRDILIVEANEKSVSVPLEGLYHGECRDCGTTWSTNMVVYQCPCCPASQPIADGGGLLIRRPEAFFDSTIGSYCVAQEVENYVQSILAAYASSQEDLRVNSATMCEAIESHSALRERMQQAVEVLEMKSCLASPFANMQAIRKAIKLLSPEGSSR